MVKKIINILEDGRLAGPHKRVLGVSSYINHKSSEYEVYLLLPIHKSKLLRKELEGFDQNFLREIIMFPLSRRPLYLMRYILFFPVTISLIILIL